MFQAPFEEDSTLLTPSLCAYGLSTRAQRGVVAVVAASSLRYVFRQWAPIVNKAIAFGAMGLDWSLSGSTERAPAVFSVT